MVTVGDQRLAGREICGDAARPSSSLMAHSRCRSPSDVRALISGSRAASGDDVSGGTASAAAVVQQEDRLQVGLGRLHQREPPGNRPGPRPHAGARRRLGRDQPHRADQAALQPVGASVIRGGSARTCTTPAGVGDQDVLVLPMPQRLRRVVVLLAGRPGTGLGRMRRTTLCGSAAITGPLSLKMTSYGGEVTSASRSPCPARNGRRETA